jgi:hypothetical protein
MNSVLPLALEHLEARIQTQLEKGLLQAIDGRLQRVNYLKKELAVVADGQIVYFTLDKDSQLWFDDQKAILRCFHPLDQVKVIFQEGDPNLVKALYAWEKQIA